MIINTAEELKTRIQNEADPTKVEGQMRFFKTGKGQYGEGDIFCGVSNPKMRCIVKDCKDLPLDEVKIIIKDPIHEVRMTALFTLVNRYIQLEKTLAKEKDENKRTALVSTQKEIVDLYLQSTPYINNWDLVDLSCELLGLWLLNRDRTILYTLAKSENMWENRIAIVCTYKFIREGQFEDTYALVEILKQSKQDLIHKAMGWMLREIGKRDLSGLQTYLRANVKTLPRTTWRYAIERFSPQEKKEFMAL